MRVQDEKDYESIYVCSSHMQYRIGEKEENKDKNKQKKERTKHRRHLSNKRKK